MPDYLADTSIWVWARPGGPMRDRLAERVRDGCVVTCVPVALEYLHSARNGEEYERALADFRRLRWLPVTPAAADRALELQRALAQTTHGAHRLPAIDYLVAAVAEDAGATLWHVDSHLHRLCGLTGQPDEHESVRGPA